MPRSRTSRLFEPILFVDERRSVTVIVSFMKTVSMETAAVVEEEQLQVASFRRKEPCQNQKSR